MAAKTNWPAISAIAAVCGALIAFFAYTAPHPRVEPQRAPTAPVLTTTAPGQPPLFTPTTGAPPEVPTATPGPPLTVAPLQAAGCDKGLSIVATYYKTAGTTRFTQLSAARQAAQDMMYAINSTHGTGPYSAMVALYNDFSTMTTILEGYSGRDYASAQAQTNADAQTLRRVCGTS